ncbi:MAG: thioredoxin domain-containing protein [Planctomycetaceae bacterium]|nr:thioredoxin family protein [Planctomycetaceae bacterium]
MPQDIAELSEDSFDDEIGRSALPVLIDFHAPWCIDCRRLEPALQEAAGDFHGRLKVYKVDVDKQEALGRRFGISTIPVLVLLSSGQEVRRLVNVKDKLRIVTMIEAFMAHEKPS